MGLWTLTRKFINSDAAYALMREPNFAETNVETKF